VTRATQRKTQRAPSSAGDGDGRTMRLVKQVGVVVGVVSGVVGLLFLFFPGLRPQDSGPSNADQLPAISSVDVLPRVTQGAFLTTARPQGSPRSSSLRSAPPSPSNSRSTGTGASTSRSSTRFSTPGRTIRLAPPGAS